MCINLPMVSLRFCLCYICSTNELLQGAMVMQIRPNTLLLSAIIICGLSVSANSQESDTTKSKSSKPSKSAKCHELVDGCKAHNKKIASNVGAITKDLNESQDSNNPVKLKATIQKVRDSVRDIQTEQDELTKKLNGLDFELRAPLGAYWGRSGFRFYEFDPSWLTLRLMKLFGLVSWMHEENLLSHYNSSDTSSKQNAWTAGEVDILCGLDDWVWIIMPLARGSC